MDWLDPRWRKVLRDIWNNKARTVLVVLAIAVGVFAFGGMFITQQVLLENMNEGFQATNPATITVDMAPFEESVVRTAQRFPYVAQIGARATTGVEVWDGDSWTQLTLVTAPDVAAMDINRIELEAGTLDLRRREILLERQSLAQIEGAQVGSRIAVELPDGRVEELTVAGVVHDFNTVPASRIPVLTGYVSRDTLRLLGLPDQYNELQIVTVPQVQTTAELDLAAGEITELLERYGQTVRGSTISEPGEHWGADFIEAIVLVLLILGLLALVLSGFLVVNTITAIISQQRRQIGMMKAVGAQAGDIMGIYLMMAAAFGVLSLVIALPVGVALSRGMTRALATFLNVDVVSFAVPLWIFGVQAVTAILVPLGAALVPVLSGMRTTVREAISDYGIGSRSAGLIDRLLAALKGISRPVLISLRNTFRRKGRLALTLAVLATAGAIFIAVLHTRVSIIGEFSDILAMLGYDVQVVLGDTYPTNQLAREAYDVPDVTVVEGWSITAATIIRPEGIVIAEEEGGINRPNLGLADSAGVAQGTTNEGSTVTLFAPPYDSQFIEPTLLEGRWLLPGDDRAVVLASEVLGDEPWIAVGETIRLDFGHTAREFEVVGIVNLVGPSFAYAPFETVSRIEGSAGRASAAMLGTRTHDQDTQSAVSRTVEERFQESGIPVASTATPTTFLGVLTSQVDFFVAFMLFMALLLGAVGGLGLASTMSLNVLERTREIGVMRAIGASDGAVRGIFLSEGIVIGLISFVIASLMSIPIAYGFAVGVGLAFFDRPVGLQIAPQAFLLWLLIVVLLASVASLLPANRAAQVSVRESLAYE